MTTNIDFYYSRFYSYRPAQAYLRFSDKETLVRSDQTQRNVPKLELRLIEETQDNNWPLGTWGVLGLAPKGAFFRYLETLYDEEDSISLALKYSVKRINKSSDELEFDLVSYLNPDPEKHYKESEILATVVQDPQVNSWYLDGSVKLPGTEFAYTDQKLCLDTYTNDWFGVIEGDIWCQRVRQAVCNTTVAKKCKESEARMELAPKIEFTIDGHDLAIEPDEYIYFDEEGLQCRIGDPCMARDSEACPKDTRVVLGRMFMAKFVPILNINRGTGERSIRLVTYFKSPKSKKTYWIILGVIIVIIAVAAVIYIMSKRKQASDESHYVKV